MEGHRGGRAPDVRAGEDGVSVEWFTLRACLPDTGGRCGGRRTARSWCCGQQASPLPTSPSVEGPHSTGSRCAIGLESAASGLRRCRLGATPLGRRRSGACGGNAAQRSSPAMPRQVAEDGERLGMVPAQLPAADGPGAFRSGLSVHASVGVRTIAVGWVLLADILLGHRDAARRSASGPIDCRTVCQRGAAPPARSPTGRTPTDSYLQPGSRQQSGVPGSRAGSAAVDVEGTAGALGFLPDPCGTSIAAATSAGVTPVSLCHRRDTPGMWPYLAARSPPRKVVPRCR